jgi:general secretion pathway protein D
MRPSVNTRKSNQVLVAACVAVLAPSTVAVAGSSAEGGSTSDIASREIIRRQERIAQASELEVKGDKAMAEEDYDGAIAAYRQALDLLPNAPLTADRRSALIAKYAEACNERAGVLAAAGDYDRARGLLNNVLSEGVDPDNSSAKTLLRRLDDAGWFNPANSPEHTENVKAVTKHLQMAQGAFNLGKYDQAREEYNKVLNVDHYNTAARRQLEVLEKKISEYHMSARDHRRSELIRQVDSQWEVAVPPAAGANANNGGDIGGSIDGASATNDKLDKMIVPTVALEQATIDEAIEFLRLKSKELDTVGADASKRGINFIVNVPNPASLPKITIQLTNVKMKDAVKTICDLANLRHRVEPFAVMITPIESGGGELYVRSFRVRPDFLTLGGGGGAADAAPAADPFAGGGGTTASAIKPPAAAIDILKAAGIPFPDSASAFFNRATSTLTVRNTPSNLDLVSAFIDSTSTDVQKMIFITAKFLEVSQRNADEFGFDWLLGAFNVPGTTRVFGSGGTAGNRSSGPVGGTNWPLVPPNQGGAPLPSGGSSLLTGGLRFGQNAIANDAIDGLIGRTVTGTGSPEANVTPAVFGLGGIFTDPQFQVVLRGLNQKKGIDLLTAPSVMTRSGQRAKVEVIREFIYPTEFEPPEIPQDFGSSNSTGGGLGGLFGGGTGGGSASVSSFPVTPTTPTAFETKNTGVTLEVEPTVGSDGFTIDLTLAPSVIEFEGFVNYGSPIQTGAVDALGQPTQVVLTENRIEQPVFSTRSLSTSVTIWDGMTLGVGGLIREDVQTVEDKVPVFGDLPLIGRMFRTKADEYYKRNLTMFVTVKLLDPSGQPINTSREVGGGTAAEGHGPDSALIPQVPTNN